MPLLGVNIDHVATVRQARRGHEPSPLAAAHEALLGGAEIITVHLREDRRHINDADVEGLVASLHGGARLNLEMAATEEMVGIALRLRRAAGSPQMVTLVPEKRQELTTEGGLDVAGGLARMRKVVARLHKGGVTTVSAFITTDPRQIEASAKAGFDACEFHTGPYARAFEAAGGDFADTALMDELDALSSAGDTALNAAMRFHAGHALNYLNVRPVAALAGVAELHIGHAIVSRGIFTGLRAAVTEMKRLMETA
ncbi:MAG: pyridoxine 5'-phosphate synthase [Phycisphaerales bacterium]